MKSWKQDQKKNQGQIFKRYMYLPCVCNRILKWFSTKTIAFPHFSLYMYEWFREAQSYPTFCDPMDCSLPVSSVHGILQAKILEWVGIPFFQGIFLTQGSNSGVPHYRQILYHLSHQGSLYVYIIPKNYYWNVVLE